MTLSLSDRDGAEQLHQFRCRQSGPRTMAARTPDLNRKLAHTIKPTGGPAAQVETLLRAARTGQKPKSRKRRVASWSRSVPAYVRGSTIPPTLGASDFAFSSASFMSAEFTAIVVLRSVTPPPAVATASAASIAVSLGASAMVRKSYSPNVM